MNQLALDNSDRHCIFQSGDDWFGIPALSIRSIVPRPAISQTPYSDPILQGISHVQNEFVPVISFQSLTQVQYDAAPGSEQQLLIMTGSHGPWGLLIDQAVALSSLETSISTFSGRHDRWSSVTVGSASFQNQVVQILDPTAMYQYASNLLEMYWQNNEQNEVSCYS
jgi:purine-binding chemotaxis protein CheW